MKIVCKSLLTPFALCLTSAAVSSQEQEAVAEAAVKAATTPGHESDDSMSLRSDPTDAQITDAIEDELQSDPAVVTTRIDTVTADGIVTLTGSVDNLLAKQRAARLAMAVRGVKAVVNRIAVTDSGRSNRAIRFEVGQALLLDPATEAYKIDMDVTDGQKVTLTGDVESYAEKRLAERVASGVRGVRSLDNQLTVDFKTDRLDFEVKNDIQGQLRWNRFLDGARVTVQLNDGHASFRGVVGSAAEKYELERTAWVAGVKSVDVSGVGVERWARDPDLRANKYASKSDSEVQQAVESALRHDPRVLSFNVQVAAEGGAVTLRGTVDNLKAKRAAGQNAENCVGVWRVNNRVKVRPETLLEDAAIAVAIEQALLRDPWVEGFQITVGVKNGTATLDGSVDNTFDRARADDVAARVIGVERVRNQLTITDPTLYGYDPHVEWWYSPTEFDWYNIYAPVVSRSADNVIRTDIRNKLWWSPFVDEGQVTVKVEGGCATLSGTVDSLAESMAAIENAYEGGAVRVVNDLTVGGDSQ
tara:strand:- start:145 stop:1734 length:1590 start_codon:yes stop_codon:yes gene_type:complete